MKNTEETETLKQQTEADDAFAEAIRQGRLSEDRTAPNYAGDYMYMGPGLGERFGFGAFKHWLTGRYLP